ncbi:phytanoyl-CoA dioxygenase family protein [Streptomyces sp. NPDC058637]|uniref:phytanoyl-CoA dioxygenase family protein n=1 Tax=Streptomyces sp. NPDC058637 TaxID=3346569 RepID=UPI00364A0A20
MSAWLALTEATLVNGCLHIAPGPHELGYRRVKWRPSTGTATHGRADQASWPRPGSGMATLFPSRSRQATPILLGVALPHRSVGGLVVGRGHGAGLGRTGHGPHPYPCGPEPYGPGPHGGITSVGCRPGVTLP